MKLKEKIHTDILAAMKAKEDVRMGALRLLKAAVMKFEVAGDKKKEASDEEVLQIIGREVKQRKDSIDAYKKGGRADLAVKEEAELKILQAYLPAQMDEAELKKVVSQVISQTGAASKADFGKVMGAVMAQVKGKADGQMVSQLVGEILK
ncbi:GatB/YqeY domain-containing protein [Candidatus Peregrinibacteria bacterium]|nr:GatB/YqeY domain-containing protein [Candidatus Peregrinibacteria bacterium]